MIFAFILGIIAGGVSIPLAGFKLAAVIGLVVFVWGARRTNQAAQDAVVFYQYNPNQQRRSWF